jgi:hypothetical protein
MMARYDDQGIRFDYPASWELDEDDDDARATITVQSSGGLAFVMVTLDADRPSPGEMAGEALSAMKEEYPDIQVSPTEDRVGGHRAEGFDLEFFSVDMPNACLIRSFRTPSRTVLVFGQWSAADADEEEPEEVVRGVLRSLEEAEGGG